MAAAPLTYLFNRDELCAVFGDLRRIERIKQRIFHLNRIGEPLGIRLSFSGIDGTLAIHSASSPAILKLCQRLTKGKGHIQRGLGHLLSRKIGAPIEQAQQLCSYLNALGHIEFLDLNKLEISPAPFNWALTWVNPVFKADFKFQKSAQTHWDETLALWLKNKPDTPLFIQGQAGSGKTMLLRRVWEKLAEEYRLGDMKKTPLLIPATTIKKDFQGRFSIVWDVVGVIDRGIYNQLEELFNSRRLILLIDGLEDNPALVDWSDAAVVRFWTTALKNSCAISIRSDFRRTDMKSSVLEQWHQAEVLELEPWSLGATQAFFHQTAVELKNQGSLQAAACLEHLSRLNTVALEQFLAPIPKNALAVSLVVAAAAFWRQGQLPRNGFELASFVIEAMIAWETAKVGSYLKKDTATGVLERLSWQSCTRAWSATGPAISLQALWDETRRRYPFFEGHANELFASLGRMPFLRYEGQRERFVMEPWAAPVLAARYLLEAAGIDGLPPKKELMGAALFSPSVIFQALEELDWQLGKSESRAAKKAPPWVKKVHAALLPLLRILRQKRQKFPAGNF
ncbi:MAG: NACHT domain-containing protein [Elusimicrobia bacterium]|nr:NACHT domain-containing protein [Elusimicrobiota bacterium]